MKILFLISLIFNLQQSALSTVDWSSNAQLPGEEKCFISHGDEVCLRDGDRENIYNKQPAEHIKFQKKGALHTLQYPVTTTKLLLPKSTLDNFFNAEANSPLRRFIFKIAKVASPFKNETDLYTWLGLHEFPQSTLEVGPNYIPRHSELEKYPMGVTLIDHQGSQGITFSCAACHSNNLFGTKVLGISNRFPRANEIFLKGKKLMQAAPPILFAGLTGANAGDRAIYESSYRAVKYIGLKMPLALGLDTSLAQVGLSLAKRNADEYATIPKRPHSIKNHHFNKNPADSKPAVWWNLKYKTKWLSDASIDSGNPVHTNFLWNEIGRGADLKELENWLKNNDQKIKELTSYVFATKAPRYNDYFPHQIDIEKAKRGEQLFLNNCIGCHGIYEKAWNDNNITEYQQQLVTTKIWYHKKTIVKDVATDSNRYMGMKFFSEDLNRLQISKSIGTVVKPNRGYVPPPLVGIWSRWPYLHNNSVPTLYHLLSSAKNRPQTYIATPSEDKELDFDNEKNGYPRADYIKEPYQSNPKYGFDTRKKGLSNQGHESMLVNEDGSEKFSHTQKLELIQFLKSL